MLHQPAAVRFEPKLGFKQMKRAVTTSNPFISKIAFIVVLDGSSSTNTLVHEYFRALLLAASIGLVAQKIHLRPVRPEQSCLLRDALEVLTTEERKAIETAFFFELTYEQTARKLNQPIGTVKTRIRSGLEKLREALEGK